MYVPVADDIGLAQSKMAPNVKDEIAPALNPRNDLRAKAAPL